MDIRCGNAVVEELLLLVAEVAEPIPLARGLCVKDPDVVVDGPWRLGEDVVVEDAPVEEGTWRLGVEGPV
jgi:hypothetical protein